VLVEFGPCGLDLDEALDMVAKYIGPRSNGTHGGAFASIPNGGLAEGNAMELKTRSMARVRAPKRTLSPAARARALLREQLKYGPTPAAQVEVAAAAAEIPRLVLLAATDELGVRSRRGEWRLTMG
jgi:hypothetical protein